jgi:hypothetical protein
VTKSVLHDLNTAPLLRRGNLGIEKGLLINLPVAHIVPAVDTVTAGFLFCKNNKNVVLLGSSF